jgi:hypothetical protein
MLKQHISFTRAMVEISWARCDHGLLLHVMPRPAPDMQRSAFVKLKRNGPAALKFLVGGTTTVVCGARQ